MKNIRMVILAVICLVCIVVFCMVAITGKIYTLGELPLNFMGTFLGAMVSAILMLILLTSQSTAEEIKKKNVIVFKKKSEIYEEFISCLYKVLQEQKISGTVYRKIKSEFYTKLALYLKTKSQLKISNNIVKLVDCIGVEMNDCLVTSPFHASANLAALNENYYKLRENIFSIINILIDDIGLGGKVDIKMQNCLERSDFPYLLYQTLLEETDNFFIRKDGSLFEKAFFTLCKDGPFIVIPIKGENTPGGEIQIGPFPNNSQGESIRARLVFRLFSPQFNPLAEPYASGREAKVEGEYINFYFEEPENKFAECDQIDLTDFENSKLEELEKMGVEIRDIYNGFIYQFGFDDNAYNLYYGVYVSICKTIAARAYFYFFTARTDKDNMPIKELCEKFGEVTYEEINIYIGKKQGIDLSD